MSWCAVKDCNSGRKHRAKLYGNEGSDVRFFRFPKTSYYCDKWIDSCGKNRNGINTNNARICSLHFDENAYIPKPLVETMLGISPRHKRKLKFDALPTLKVWNTSSCIDYVEKNTTETETTNLVDAGLEQIHQEPLNNELVNLEESGVDLFNMSFQNDHYCTTINGSNISTSSKSTIDAQHPSIEDSWNLKKNKDDAQEISRYLLPQIVEFFQ